MREIAAGTVPAPMARATWERLVRDLLQALAEAHDPLRELDAGFDHWLAHGPLDHTTDDHAKAVDWALHSDVDLAVVFALAATSDADVRQHLEALRHRLVMELGTRRRRR